MGASCEHWARREGAGTRVTLLFPLAGRPADPLREALCGFPTKNGQAGELLPLGAVFAHYPLI